MGLAASQGRFLSLTARKTNVEFEGQQVNQARTNLSNQSANLYNQSLNMSVPTPPSVNQFTKTTYAWTDTNNAVNIINSLTPIAGSTPGTANYNITTTTNPTPQAAIVERDPSGRMKSITIGGITHPLSVSKDTDNTAFNDAMQQYEFNKNVYTKKLDDLNSHQAIIQAQDKSLEIKLKSLDTEQQAIQTEVDAVTKVIDKNIEATFKTFA